MKIESPTESLPENPSKQLQQMDRIMSQMQEDENSEGNDWLEKLSVDRAKKSNKTKQYGRSNQSSNQSSSNFNSFYEVEDTHYNNSSSKNKRRMSADVDEGKDLEDFIVPDDQVEYECASDNDDSDFVEDNTTSKTNNQQSSNSNSSSKKNKKKGKKKYVRRRSQKDGQSQAQSHSLTPKINDLFQAVDKRNKGNVEEVETIDDDSSVETEKRNNNSTSKGKGEKMSRNGNEGGVVDLTS